MESNTILELIRSISLFRKNYVNFISKNLSDFDITTSEFAYLKEVVNLNGITQDEIIKNLSIDKAAATRIAQSLEKKGLIKRVRNINNKRFFNVFLTESGLSYIDFTNNLLNEFHNISFSKNTDDFDDFLKILKKVNNNFK